jgi:hypothetical protein
MSEDTSVDSTIAPVEPVVEPVIETPVETVKVEPTVPVIDEEIPVKDAVVSKSVREKAKPKAESKKDIDADKVALFSTKNLHSAALGAISQGYNIVDANKAEKWLAHKAVRKATPEEVAAAYAN